MLGDLQGVQEDNVLADARNGSSSCKTWRYFDIKGCYLGQDTSTNVFEFSSPSSTSSEPS
jgi:hypothetical protein